MEIPLETVYVVDEWYDGPRTGFANFQQKPHFYRSLFLDIENDDDYDPDEDRFELTPVPEQVVDWAVASHQLWRKWDEAYRAGTLLPDVNDGMRVLPEDRALYTELRERVEMYMSAQSSPSFIVRGKFELGSRRVQWQASDRAEPPAT